MKPRRVLVLGAAGMLGHVLFSSFSERGDMDVFATVRAREGLDRWFSEGLFAKIRGGVDAEHFDSVCAVLNDIRPETVVNCIGVVKQLAASKDPVLSISVNALFPHLLARACREIGARSIHFSTDCVFSGAKGNYSEDDPPDPPDMYGRTKLLGEVDSPGCLTVRTSVIGHELSGRNGLLEWFLGQDAKVKGFAGAVFSGFPTVELARILCERIFPNEELAGIYHVSSEPIAKFDLLKLVADKYGKKIAIDRELSFSADRSLDSSRFRKATGYEPPAWPELVSMMHAHFLDSPLYASRARIG